MTSDFWAGMVAGFCISCLAFAVLLIFIQVRAASSTRYEMERFLRRMELERSRKNEPRR